MNKVIKRDTFYVELSPERIKIATKTAVSLYPIWLGKNRAVIRDVISYFNKNQPETLTDCLHIVGHFGLSGQGTREKPNENFFETYKKGLDKHNNFW